MNRASDLAPELSFLTHYFSANAWDIRRPERNDENVWLWEQPEIQAQILELRRAIRHEGFENLHVVRRCQMLTNLANELDHVGRLIEAVRYFDRAPTLQGNFAMALGLDFIHVAIDDASRIALAHVAEDESALTATGLLERTVADYAARGSGCRE